MLVPGKAGYHIRSSGKYSGLYACNKEAKDSAADDTYIMCARLGRRPSPQWVNHKPGEPIHQSCPAGLTTSNNMKVQDQDGSPYYIARAVIPGRGMVLGKTTSHLKSLHYPFQSVEAVSKEPYEVGLQMRYVCA